MNAFAALHAVSYAAQPNVHDPPTRFKHRLVELGCCCSDTFAIISMQMRCGLAISNVMLAIIKVVCVCVLYMRAGRFKVERASDDGKW